jgi:hypothetical protein
MTHCLEPTHRFEHDIWSSSSYHLVAGNPLIKWGWINGIQVAYFPTEERAQEDYVAGICTVEQLEAVLDVVYGIQPSVIEYTLRGE